MHEELPLALRLVVEAVTELVRGDVRPEKPELTLQHRPVGTGKGNLAVPHRFHLGAGKNYTALDRLEYGIVVPGLPVLGKDRIELPVSRHTAN